ncbi:MAG: hypothetical protein Q7T55_23030 [Solirubrobacteraceae bacterium]|nr:hypothetical protein [Solirubrobacteraceae bacterium]
MTTVQLAIFVPLVAGLLWFGLGALVNHLASGGDDERRLPRLLWPVLGFAASIVLANGISRLGIVLPFNAIIIVALALAGFWLERRHLLPTPKQAGLALVTAGPIVVAFSGAILLAGPTITGYLLDSNTGVHSLGADYLLHHGGDFAAIPRTSTDNAMIAQFFVDSSYPSGAHAIYGLLGALTGASLTFVSTPMMGICLAVAGLATAAAARRLDVPPLIAALTGFLVTCGALVFAFGLSSEIKEVVTLPLLAGMTAFAVDPEALRRPRAIIVVGAVFGAALYSVLGVAAAAWAAPLVVFLVLRALVVPAEGRDLLGAVRTLGLTAVLGLVLIGPLLPGLADQLQLANNLSASNATLAADPGNLLGPIHKTQALGTWLSSDHRTDPGDRDTTYGIIGITWLLVGAGAFAILRERRWSAALWLAGLVVLWYVLTARGTLWLDSKLVMLSSLTLMLLVGKGVAALASGQPRPAVRVALGVALLGPVGYGVLTSDQMLYASTTTASEERYAELESYDREFKGQGPAFFTEFDEYAMYTLRNLHFVSTGYGDQTEKPVVEDGPGSAYGQSVDVDRLDVDDLRRFKILITLRSPGRSDPGTDWTRVRQGKFFDVWKRDPAKTERVLRHVSVGSAAVGKPKCEAITSAAALAEREGAKLVARVASGRTVVSEPDDEKMTPNWQISWRGYKAVSGGGSVPVPIPSDARGQDRSFWISGTVGRPLQLTTEDGRVLGTFDRLAAGDGNVVGPVTVPAGTGKVIVRSTGRQIRPGDKAPSVLRYFLLAPVDQPVLKTVDPDDARLLCSEQLDWVEVVKN